MGRRARSLAVGVLGSVLLLGVAADAQADERDLETQGNLRNAMTAAKVIFTDNEDYNDASVFELSRAEPALGYTEAVSTGPTQVSIRTTTTTFVAAARSDTGRCFAIRDVMEPEPEGGTSFAVITDTPCDAGAVPEEAFGPTGWGETPMSIDGPVYTDSGGSGGTRTVFAPLLMLPMLLLPLLFIGSSIWVAVDAARYRDRYQHLGVHGPEGMSPFLWLVCCLLLWIVAFPYYLVKRSQPPRTATTVPTGSLQERRPVATPAAGTGSSAPPSAGAQRAEEPAGERRFCTECGAAVPTGAKFCAGCGSAVRAP